VRADVFVLSTGGRVEGELINANESPREKYVIKTTLGAEVTLSREQVKEVIRPKPAEIEYAKVAKEASDTVDGQWAMAEWCREHSLPEARKAHLKRVIELDPNHVKARGALGYGMFDGQWKTQAERMTEMGYVEYKGTWKLPQEVELIEAEQKRTIAEKRWFNDLKRWREWYDSDKRQEAIKNIRAITDPTAVPALKKQLETDPSEPVRLLMAEALARVATGEAYTILAIRSLEDPSDEVRQTCLDHLDDTPKPAIRDLYIQKLKDNNNAIVNRAAIGLARLKDPIAVSSLVDALITTHRTPVGGAPQGTYSATFTPNGGTFGFGGGGAKMIVQDIRNPAVLDALVSLVGSATNFNFDVAAWKKYLASKRQSQMLDARRG
jgi:hypothetical protein